MFNHIGANENVESIKVIPAQTIVFGKLAFPGKYIRKRFSNPGNNLALYPGIIVTGTNVIIFGNTMDKFFVGLDIVMDVHILRIGIKRTEKKGTGKNAHYRDSFPSFTLKSPNLEKSFRPGKNRLSPGKIVPGVEETIPGREKSFINREESLFARKNGSSIGKNHW